VKPFCRSPVAAPEVHEYAFFHARGDFKKNIKQEGKMRKARCVRGSAVFCLLLGVALWLIPVVWAKDWHELQDMSDRELAEQIAEFQEKLNQNPADYEMLKAIGITFHIKANQDVKEFAPKAVEFLTRAHEIDEKDYETMCYLGSATTMMARTTANPIKKMSYVNKGTGFMDKAVRKDPDNISVRLTRAFNSKSLPSFLDRGHIAMEDFEHLAGLIEKNPEVSQAIRKTVYSNLAELYGKAGDQAKAERFSRLAEN
jgi:cytochrome c-type biogenesis protein CcmH/NrfG